VVPEPAEPFEPSGDRRPVGERPKRVAVGPYPERPAAFDPEIGERRFDAAFAGERERLGSRVAFGLKNRLAEDSRAGGLQFDQTDRAA
jgi:hypothetical protein